MLIEDGRISQVTSVTDGIPESAKRIDLGGRTLLPGLIDAHAHIQAKPPQPAEGAEPLWPETSSFFLPSLLQNALRMGVTTLRNVGSYGNDVEAARQAVRYGAFRGPRLLTCGKIISATAPGGRFFDGMYREADGSIDIRRAVREQIRRGADFLKLMSTGARSVELEDPNPAQLTSEEIAVLIDEAHRMGRRVAAHAEGLDGTELSIRLGVDTVEHGMYLHQRPELLDLMAASGQVLVPTLSCFYGVAGLGEQIAPSVAAADATWTPALVELAEHNLEAAGRTLRAAQAAGVPIALGHDWMPFGDVGIELLRMIEHGMTPAAALISATATGARALGIDEHVGTIEVGKLADLLVVDGDPLSQPHILRERAKIWLVFQLGTTVAGAAGERELEPTQ